MIIYNQKMLYVFLGTLIISFYLLFLPLMLNAQILITEIMYDPEGTDTGREWVEIYNSGPVDVDLATYKLFESNVNHKITNYNEIPESILKPGGFAIIADNPEKFLIEFPDFKELLFDSTFSLNNTGEPISIIDNENNTDDQIQYVTDWGGKDNGFSLQKNDSDFWVEAKPTLAQKNKQESEIVVDNSQNTSTNSTTTTTTSTNSTHISQNDLTNYKEPINLEIGAGRHRIVTINTPIEFNAVFNTDKKPKFMWSFGDGSSKNGSKIEHSYKKEGIYNVVLNGLLDKTQSTARTKITVTKPDVEILSITSGKDVDILLKNRSDKELNLGKFVLKVGKKYFEIVPDTIIDAKSEIIIPYQYTNFEINSDFSPAEIHYAEGDLIYKETLTQEILNAFANFLAQNSNIASNSAHKKAK